MPSLVIRYKTKPERAEENQELIEKVFAELEAVGASGFGYASFRLDDGVSFVHVVVEEEAPGSVSLAELPAFQANVERNQKLVQEAKQRLAAAKTTFNQDEAQLYKDVQAQH